MKKNKLNQQYKASWVEFYPQPRPETPTWVQRVRRGIFRLPICWCQWSIIQNTRPRPSAGIHLSCPSFLQWRVAEGPGGGNGHVQREVMKLCAARSKENYMQMNIPPQSHLHVPHSTFALTFTLRYSASCLRNNDRNGLPRHLNIRGRTCNICPRYNELSYCVISVIE